MKNKIDDEIVYSINNDDIQDVANEVLERPLTKRELIKVSKSIGDHLDWFQAIENAINEHVKE